MNMEIHDLKTKIKDLEADLDQYVKDKRIANGLLIEKTNKIFDLEKTLSEIKHCKIGDVVLYTPNAEDKTAQFVASLVQSVQDENDKVTSDIKVLLEYIAKGAMSVDEEMVDEIAAKYEEEL